MEIEFVVDLAQGAPPPRLDAYLAGQVALGASRSQAQRLCNDGCVRVDGQEARPGRRLRPGERVRVALAPPRPSGLAAEDIPLDIVYEDLHLIVVNKPRGLVVHPAPGHQTGTLVNALLRRLGVPAAPGAHTAAAGAMPRPPARPGIGGELRPGIVHRLDKDTTGLIVVAKDERTLGQLSAQIARREVSRRYLAIVHGSPPDAFVIDAPLGRSPSNRQRMAVLPAGGREARSHVTVRRHFARHALVEAALETGRTHQLRVHLAFAGFPVVADPVYGRRGAGDLGLAGQALHAFQLSFVHPVKGHRMSFEAPPPPDFAAALEQLGAES